MSRYGRLQLHQNLSPNSSLSRPELSQDVKIALMAGGSSSIGYAIAKAFVQASAAKVIILGRWLEAIQDATKQLRKDSQRSEVVGLACHVSKPDEVDKLSTVLEREGTRVGVQVLNAAGMSRPVPILKRGTEGVWEDYEMNVRGDLDMTERFYKQKREGHGSQKLLVNVSTHAIHDWTKMPGYGLTKNGGTLVLQLIVVRNAANLPGQFAVWTASPEARFLHGRFVWTEWDVEELKSGAVRERI
ncbi:uncharacterized protein BCR38DRAFT_456897 [Pseudomassariella vexata]|uniref:NAD(P)-binding protein n=1 Tax=Pseudomassariella vexata TaxID=1141098 RepID=A0A1Y2E431_9PEZI|nr:uncharacterized protein BCR38DRAFT_456897 [Pseudomassariella vexata]ORY66318.1 hypothetical protein BCR38DRAFT_456897 [Pseudomassariella vexata]